MLDVRGLCFGRPTGDDGHEGFWATVLRQAHVTREWLAFEPLHCVDEGEQDRRRDRRRHLWRFVPVAPRVHGHGLADEPDAEEVEGWEDDEGNEQEKHEAPCARGNFRAWCEVSEKI